MQTFGIRDLRKRSGELTRTAESGQMALITCRDKPLLLGIPFTEELLEQGVALNLAIHLFRNNMSASPETLKKQKPFLKNLEA